jgi:hypothetical protein
VQIAEPLGCCIAPCWFDAAESLTHVPGAIPAIARESTDPELLVAELTVMVVGVDVIVDILYLVSVIQVPQREYEARHLQDFVAENSRKLFATALWTGASLAT